MNPTPEFTEAIKRHRRLVDTLNMEHLDAMRARMLAMERASKKMIDDGSLMFRREDIAERPAVSPNGDRGSHA